ncbi:hypothetical protein ACJRO7_013628 [Eucalyptus globulus]|uniref:Xylanase inhibitor N-terminal domain-containing protein n=1 Tax=Eucalyptus globulus TaxID=34317 RepID=A0ABD3KYB3_EUCGL
MALLCQILLLLTNELLFMLSIIVTNSDATGGIGTSSMPKGVVAQPIHRNSIQSPFFDPNYMDIDCVKFALENSVARCKVNASCSDNIQANLQSKTPVGVFFVEFYIEDTSHPVLAVMDTGSTLLGLRCIPCKNCAQASVPIYDPSTSSTYTNISCLSEYCEALHRPKCDERKNCKYEGCSHESGEKPDSVMGVFKLNNNKLSLATQQGAKFSYCVGKLILGEGAILEGDSTPLDVYKRFYCVTLQGTSLGFMLNIPRAAFKRTASRKELANAVREKMEVKSWFKPYEVLNSPCFEGDVNKDVEGLPVFTFHFSGCAKLGLEADSLPMTTVIGMNAQQFHNVGYDISGKKIVLEGGMDCELPDER